MSDSFITENSNKWCAIVVSTIIIFVLLFVGWMFLAVFVLSDCETQNNNKYSMDQLNSSSFDYIFPVSLDSLYQIADQVLRNKFSILSSLRLNDQDAEVRTKLLHYKKSGRRFRKQCVLMIWKVSYKKKYVAIRIRCEIDQYRTKWNMGCIHTPFDFLDYPSRWYGESLPRLILREEIVEEMRKSLGLQEKQIVQLPESYNDEELPEIIENYEFLITQ